MLWDIMTLFAANAIVYYALCYELRYKDESLGKTNWMKEYSKARKGIKEIKQS